MNSYRVGDVVNGHVWTGTEWEIAPPPPGPQPREFEPPEPGSDVRAWGILAAIGAGVLFGLALIYLASDLLRAYYRTAPNDDLFAPYVLGLSDIGKRPALVLWVSVLLGMGLAAVSVLCFRRARRQRATHGPVVEAEVNGPREDSGQ